MEIFLVRHGIAEDAAAAEEQGRGDAERALTKEGLEKTARVARAFRKQITRVDVIYHSSFVRAAETAKLFAREFPDARLEAAKGLTPMDSPKSALPLLSGLGEGERFMLVGHEPHLSALASLLLTGKEHPILEFKRAGVAGIECLGSIHQCRLNFLLSPKWL